MKQQFEMRTLSYLVNPFLSLAFDFKLAKSPEEDIVKEVVLDVRNILSCCPRIILPSDVGYSPNGEGTLYFSSRAQNRVVAEM